MKYALPASLLLLYAASALAAPLRINGSTTVNPVVAEAAEVLRQEQDLAIQVDTLGGSSGGISAVGDGRVELGMSSRPLNDADRSKYPGAGLTATTIGFDAVALVVSQDVWNGGVRALSQEQMRGIYEGRIGNWQQLGGPDRRIAFFNKEPGRGTWSVFAQWLYGDAKLAPLVSFLEVGANEETRSKVASTRGALSQLSASWADGERVFALAIVDENGVAVKPSLDNIESGAYPMARPLVLVTRQTPTAEAKVMIDFLLGERGQRLVVQHGYVNLPAKSAIIAAP